MPKNLTVRLDHDLADSALHAPAAGFGDTDLYPDFVDKAAVLIVRLAQNHPLPDGSKRAAWVSLRCSSTSTIGPRHRNRASTRPTLPSSPSLPGSGTSAPPKAG